MGGRTAGGLVDSLLADQRARWRKGTPLSVESYLERHPSLHDDPDGLLELACNEVLLREEAGESPQLDEYVRRFPHLGPGLRSRLDTDRAVGDDRTTAEDPALATGQTPPRVASTQVPESPAAAPFPTSWPTIADFEIRGELGHGGMGVVYRAFDRRRGEVVALKTVQRMDPAALSRFKQEFRVLADVHHPNLVMLHELGSDGRTWFYTMELIDGENFLSFVRYGPDGPGSGSAPIEATRTPCPPSPGLTAVDPSGSTLEQASGPEETHRTPPARDRRAAPPALSAPQLDRLRKVLGQLAEGMVALHDAGKLHRDIKPNNVLVTRRGRVVLLDFGLAAELDRAGLHQSTEPHVLGTIAYMAPEQAAGRPVSPASDWYSVGVMLYEALTGRFPFVGGMYAVLLAKQQGEPPPPREVVPEIPEDLDALCVDLLRLDPERRPTGRDVLLRLGAGTAEAAVAAPPPSPVRGAPLIGRGRHLEALADAFATMARGRTLALFVHGRSGAGKSTLVRRFLDDLAERDEAVVFAGRCYEREAVPYKALDNLVDALARYLRHLPLLEAQALLPRDVPLLAQVFPVLSNAEAVATAPRRPLELSDPQELRNRASAALHELLARIGDRRPLVLAIDDLQWGDVDSAAMLSRLLRHPDPPRLLLLGSYRSEDAETSPFLGALLGPPGEAPGFEVRTLAVEALTAAEAEELAVGLLGRDDAAARAVAGSVARESGGNPFFVSELVQYLGAGADLGDAGSWMADVSLDEVVRARVRRLSNEARRLLEVVAVSGRPLAQAEAIQAAGLGRESASALAALRTGRLVRSTGTADEGRVETYHDRIREAVVSGLAPEALVAHHRRLARVLEATGRADPEVLGVHFRGADQLEEAGRYYALAASQAATALAFNRAAALYRVALELRPREGVQGPDLRIRLADALANAGRGAEAAREYQQAAAGAVPAEAPELRRRAAMQLLVSGHVDEGLAALRGVLEAVGMDLPASPRRALVSLLRHRARLRLRGIGFRRREAAAVPPEELLRVDTCWSVSAGLSMVDFIRGADFQARGLLLALRAGEPLRIVRTLAVSAASLAATGESGRRRAATYFAVAESLVPQVDDPYAQGILILSQGMAAFLGGRWREAREACDRAEEILRTRCTGVARELDSARCFALWSLGSLGELAEMARRGGALLREALERGDRYAVTNLGTYVMTAVRLTADDPEGARRDLDRAIRQWSSQGFHVQHHNAVMARLAIALYTGQGRAALAEVQEQWPAYRRSHLLRVQLIRIEMLNLRARSALAASSDSPDPRPFARLARGDARRLEREDLPWADAHARLIRAGIAAVEGDRLRASALLTDAADLYETADMHLYATTARRRLGTLLGGAEGDRLVADADAWLARQQVRNPARTMIAQTPGFPD